MKRPELSDKEADELAHELMADVRIRARRKLTHEQLREAALDHNLEKCPTCSWWVDCGERIPDGADSPDRFCSNCRPLTPE